MTSSLVPDGSLSLLFFALAHEPPPLAFFVSFSVARLCVALMFSSVLGTSLPAHRPLGRASYETGQVRTARSGHIQTDTEYDHKISGRDSLAGVTRWEAAGCAPRGPRTRASCFLRPGAHRRGASRNGGRREHW